MHVCKVCGKELIRLTGHITINHNLDSYLKEFYDIDIRKEYLENKKPARKIAEEIREKTDNAILSDKGHILKYFKKNNIVPRKTSDAMQIWADSREGPWNKNQTKESHPSVKKYADSRVGKNNPFFTGMTEERRVEVIKKLIERAKDPERIKRGIKTTKEKYKNGYQHWSKTCSKEELKQILDRAKITREQNLSSGKSRVAGFESKAEKQIAEFLEEYNIKYSKQTTIKRTDKPAGQSGHSYFSYDYKILDHNAILEYNGTYWHCDPRKYDKDFYNFNKKETAQKIWDRDSEKKRLAESLGYKFLVIWEEDVKRKTKEEFKEYVIKFLEDKLNCKFEKR